MPQSPRKKREKRSPKLKLTGSDNQPVDTTRGAYAHDAKAAVRPPTMNELKTIPLDGVYPPGETPASVTYGRRLHVLKLMLDGQPSFKIRQYCQSAFNMAATATNAMVTQIRAEWQRDMRDQINHVRDEQVMRLMNDLADMRSSANKDWSKIRGHEQLLASIMGTIQPVRVAILDKNTEQRDALMDVVNDMLESGIDGEVVDTDGYTA